MVELSTWLPLSAAAVEAVPDEPAVYELGTLVRSVLLIGAVTNGLLRTTLSGHLHQHGLPHPPGRLYFRYGVAANPVEEARRRLNDFRRTHSNRLPQWQHLFPRTGRSRLQRIEARDPRKLLISVKSAKETPPGKPKIQF